MEHEGRTRLIAQGIPLEASELERKTFEAGRESMRQGWSGKLTLRQAVFESVKERDSHGGGWSSSLDRFAEYLATA